MPKKLRIVEQQMTAGMGAVTLPVADYVDVYRLYTSGSVTLSGSASLAASGTPIEGMEYLFHYVADLDYDGNTLTVFGATIPEALESTNMYIRCYYTGSAWEVTMHPDFDKELFITGGANGMLAAATVASSNFVAQSVDRSAIKDLDVIQSKIALLAVDTAQLAAGAVEVAKRGGTLNQEVIVVPLSFETGEQANNSIIIPFDCTLGSIRYDVVKDIAATDSATISPQINTVATSPSAITIAAGTLANVTATEAMVTATLSAGDELRLITAKTTAGGKVIATLTLTRT